MERLDRVSAESAPGARSMIDKVEFVLRGACFDFVDSVSGCFFDGVNPAPAFRSSMAASVITQPLGGV